MTSNPPVGLETQFERLRGISSVDVREGYVQVSVTDLEPPIGQSRLNVLKAIAERNISIDFLKLTTSGLAFLVKDDDQGLISGILDALPGAATAIEGRAVLMIYAVNIREEEGLIGQILADAIQQGAQIDHVGDMHDRLLIVTSAETAHSLANSIRKGHSNP